MLRGELLQINRAHRSNDASYKWPIGGRFSVVERAIQRAGRFRADYGDMDAQEYDLLLDQLESEIVNNSNNW